MPHDTQMQCWIKKTNERNNRKLSASAQQTETSKTKIQSIERAPKKKNCIWISSFVFLLPRSQKETETAAFANNRIVFVRHFLFLVAFVVHRWHCIAQWTKKSNRADQNATAEDRFLCLLLFRVRLCFFFFVFDSNRRIDQNRYTWRRQNWWLNSCQINSKFCAFRIRRVQARARVHFSFTRSRSMRSFVAAIRWNLKTKQGAFPFWQINWFFLVFRYAHSRKSAVNRRTKTKLWTELMNDRSITTKIRSLFKNRSSNEHFSWRKFLIFHCLLLSLSISANWFWAETDQTRRSKHVLMPKTSECNWFH